MSYRQARYHDDNVYEPHLAEKDTTTVEPDVDLPAELRRDEVSLPDLSEPELGRHYTRLSQMNWGIESGPYPLGSCTMKYNPKFTEDLAAHPHASLHPDRPEAAAQGTLEIMYTLQEYLADIGGMDAVTLQPPSGAAGEFTGIKIAKAYHEANGEGHRNEVIVPDTAHGTNPATATMAGYDVIEIESNDAGQMDLEAVRAACSEQTAALMLTNPNTVGVFEDNIQALADAVHDVGGLMYYDGANLNALVGRVRPGDMDYDIMHYNVHKTFSSPHGGGGPGAGPVGVKAELEEFLPTPHVREATGQYEFYEPPQSIGKVHGNHGNWLVLLKAFAYIHRLGDEGLVDMGEKAVLNANYLASQIDFEIPYGPFFHEFVASAGHRNARDVAKYMLDHGVHSPTTAWPEIVDQALMTEPTEIEGRDSLDKLAAAFNAAAKAAEEELAAAPQQTSAKRVDQTAADRNPRLTWHALNEE